MTASESPAGPAAGIPAYIVLDSQDPYEIAPFWCGLLGVEVIQHRDDGHVVSLGPSQNMPGSMLLTLQKVPEAKVGKNRMHFDVYVDDIEAATAQVETLGGQRWAPQSATVDDGGWITRIMVDPEGNEFCLVQNPARVDQWHPAPDEVIVRNEGRIAESR
jgi:predicted enzyme related to lactoylglutathione lyase